MVHAEAIGLFLVACGGAIGRMKIAEGIRA